MSTNYPDGIDSYTEKTDGVDTVSASHINDIQDAIEAIETELGTDPKGSFSNVADAISHKLNKTGDTLEGDLNFDLNEAINFKIERVSALPTWTSDDEGRIIYVESNDKLYFGNSAGWVELSQEPILHNTLSSLQGGQSGEYYHLTSSQHTSATRDADNSQNGLMPSGKLNNWDTAYTHKTTEDAVNGLVKCNGSGSYSSVTDNSSNWNTAYTNRVDTWTSPLQFSSNTASIQDATTSQKGAVQLQDSVDTATTKAVTPNAVSSYAIPKAMPIGRYYLSADQSINNTTWTAVQLTKDFETNTTPGTDGWDSTNYRFIIPSGQAGYYRVSYICQWKSGEDNGKYRCRIHWYDVSASTWYQKATAVSYLTTNYELSLAVEDIFYADAGDYIQFSVYEDSGTASNLSGSASGYYNIATIERIR